MNTARLASRVAAVCFCFVLAACGGGGGSDPPPAPPSQATAIGPKGGTASGPSGAQVVVPAGALATTTTIEIAQSPSGAPPLPAGVTSFGATFAFTPHGTTFTVPATVSVPFDPAGVPVGAQPVLYKTDATQNVWQVVPGATANGASMSGAVDSFSFVTVGSVPPLTRNDPVREWEFTVRPGNGDPEAHSEFSPASQTGGRLAAFAVFGPSPLLDVPLRALESTIDPNGTANGFVFATEDGVTYSVLAEAPLATLGDAAPIGSATRLKQRQSFVKNVADAKLTFTLSSVIIKTIDLNPKFGRNDSFMKGEVLLSVGAYKTPQDYFFYTAGRAWVVGERDIWFGVALDESFSRTHLWSRDDFDFDVSNQTFAVGSTQCPGQQAELRLRQPRTYTVDLSSVAVGEEFSLRADAHAETVNRKGSSVEAINDCIGSYVGAYLRDPLEIEGTTIQFSGLTPTNNPLPAPPEQTLQAPAACVPGPGPNADAGVLQFAAATFAIEEAAGGVPSIVVTRSGGTAGAVTATFRTDDGSAKAGTDYSAVAATVHFADGDSGERVVSVPIIGNTFDQPDRTVALSLSEPGNCAAIGPLASATLVIRDDDRPPTAPPAGALDEAFGSGGMATLAAFGGDESGMAVQADGKIVMVGGTFVDFVMARFTADGSLDTAFGTGGKVTTEIVGGFQQEAARAVAIQADGKIVVAGEARPDGPTLQPFQFALARYNADGSLDTSFGAGGKVIGPRGRAFAVAIQPDGKIVVAGDKPPALVNEVGEFQLARYGTNGSLDAGFGSGGLVITSFGTGTDELARRLVLQPDGKIVASGERIGATAPSDRSTLARYGANGSLDASFGAGGKVVLAAGALLGRGLALQADGKLLLAGHAVNAGVTEFALTRLEPDGSTDATFGNAGVVTTSMTGQGDLALAVALQGDGRILAAGRGNAVNPNFALARYNGDGSVDTSFASGGRLILDFFGFNDSAENVAVQPDGKIVLGGLARNNVDGYGLTRVNP